jgi:hypothetical protein
MNAYHMPLKGMKEGRFVREVHCAVCDSVDFFFPEHGKPSNAELIYCAACGSLAGAYNDLLAPYRRPAGFLKAVQSSQSDRVGAI